MKFFLNRIESACELAICISQSLLWINAHMPGQIGNDEEQVTKFLMAMGRALGLCQLADFLVQLVEHLRNIWPVKAHPRRTLLQFDRPRQRRQTQSNPVQRAALIGLRAFCGFNGFPINGLLSCGFIPRLIAKNMWMPGDHFIADRISDAVKGEKPLLSPIAV